MLEKFVLPEGFFFRRGFTSFGLSLNIHCSRCKAFVCSASGPTIDLTQHICYDLLPKWTVHYNIVSPESGKWVGTGWEFFDDESKSSSAYSRHIAAGNCPTKRPFHRDCDLKHLGAAHQFGVRRKK